MMSQFAQRTALAFGLATAAFAFAPSAQAQIQVTGGVIDGNAAFFNDGTDISLFDIAITNMQLVSPNGVLTNPIFVPTAAGGFVDKDGGGTVTAGDTGLITGELSGIGFDQSGSIVPFSRVDTAVAYQVSRFQQIGVDIAGDLVTSDVLPIPQLFFVGTAPTGLGTNPKLVVTGGDLQVGELNTNVTAGVIDLPSTLQIASTGGGSYAFRSVFASEFGTSERSFSEGDDDDFEVDDDRDDDDDRDVRIRLGGAQLVYNVKITLNGSSTFVTSSSTSLTTAKAFIEAFLEEISIDSLSHNSVINVFSGDDGGDDDGDDDDDGGESRYQIIKSPTYRVRIRQTPSGNVKVTVRVHSKRGNRVLLALRGDALLGAFEQCGPSSRMFPGLAGLRQLSDEEAAELYEELQAEDTASNDDGDDVAGDDDGDDVAGDDDGDDDGDDVAGDDDGEGEAEAPALGPVFEGLDNLSPEEVDAINEQINPAAPGAETPGATPEAPAETPGATPEAPATTPGATPEAPAATPGVAPEAPAETPAAEGVNGETVAPQ